MILLNLSTYKIGTCVVLNTQPSVPGLADFLLCSSYPMFRKGARGYLFVVSEALWERFLGVLELRVGFERHFPGKARSFF